MSEHYEKLFKKYQVKIQNIEKAKDEENKQRKETIMNL